MKILGYTPHRNGRLLRRYHSGGRLTLFTAGVGQIQSTTGDMTMRELICSSTRASAWPSPLELEQELPLHRSAELLWNLRIHGPTFI